MNTARAEVAPKPEPSPDESAPQTATVTEGIRAKRGRVWIAVAGVSVAVAIIG